MDIYSKTKGRQLNTPADRAKDVVSLGTEEIHKGTIDRWWNERKFKRGTRELWKSPEEESSVPQSGSSTAPAHDEDDDEWMYEGIDDDTIMAITEVPSSSDQNGSGAG